MAATRALHFLAFACLLVGCSSVPSVDQEYRAISIQSFVDRQKQMQACVAKHGFVITILPTGEVKYSSEQIPEEQFDLVDAAIEECNKKYPPAVRTEPWPREKLPRLYALELEALKCIRSLGVIVAGPPSEQRFIDAYGTPQAWSARDAALTQSSLKEDMYTKVTVSCPEPEYFGAP